MASTKLSAEDKKAIVKLYQEVGQTAATVAEKYGVSVSTISRLLKSELPAKTYESLVRQKRGGGETKSKKRTSRKKPVSKLKKEVAKPDPVEEAADEPELTATQAADSAASEITDADGAVSEITSETEEKPTRRRRTRRSAEKKRPVSRRKSKESEAASLEEVAAEEIATPEAVDLESTPEVEEVSASKRRPSKRTRPRLKQAASEEVEAVEDPTVEVAATSEVVEEEEEIENKPRRRKRRRTRASAVVEELPEVVEVNPDAEEEVIAEADSEKDLQGALVLDDLESETEDFDDAFDEDDLDDDDDGSDNITSLRRRSSSQDLVQIQPLSEANLSRMLYLVIDRTADLITMPMVFFSDLGQLPEEEEEKKTLPVFENHRVARRFSQRNQRVIKVPDGELISKTASWLEAKGITRCLLDGQVYSLESADR